MSGRIKAALLAVIMTVACLTGNGAIAQQSTTSLSSLSFAIDIPSIEAENSSMSADAIKSVIEGDLAGQAENLAELNADRISIPLISLTYKSPVTTETSGAETTVEYRDIVIDRVVDGVANSLSIGSMSSTQTDIVAFELGQMSMADVNFRGMLAFYGLVEHKPQAESQILYADAVVEGGNIKSPEADCTIGNIELAWVRARPTSVSFLDFFKYAASIDAAETAGKEPSAEAVSNMVGYLADLFEAYETAPITMAGFACDAKDDAGEAVHFELGEVSIAGLNGLKYPEVSITDIDIRAKQGMATLGKFVLKEIDFTETVNIVREAAAENSLNEDWFEANGRRLVPEFKGFYLEEFDIDAENEDAPGERIRAKIQSFDLSLSDYRNAIPTSAASTLSHMVVDLPQSEGEESIEMLRMVGFEQLDVGYNIKLNWNETNNTIVLEDLSINAADLGALGTELVLGNATPALFALDENVAMAAGLQLNLQSFGFDVVNDGMLEIVYKLAAAKEDTNPDSIPPIASGMAQGLILATFASNPDAANFASAVANFLRGGTRLSADFHALDEAGIPVLELVGVAEDPSILADKVSIEAEWE